MRKRQTWRATGLALAIAAAPQIVSADETARLHISVHVVADARVPRDVVEGAKPEAARIYQYIGIDVVFVDEPSADTITMRVVERPLKDAKEAAMGVAPRSPSQIGRLAYAFYGRVDMYARQHAKPVAQVTRTRYGPRIRPPAAAVWLACEKRHHDRDVGPQTDRTDWQRLAVVHKSARRGDSRPRVGRHQAGVIPFAVSNYPIIRRSLALALGMRLGAYEITAQSGAGVPVDDANGGG